MKKKTSRKLVLNKETLTLLKKVTGGVYRDAEVASDGPVVCYFSDCNPCETTIFATS